MPTSAEILVDTSVAVALVVADHHGHAQTTRSLAGWRLGLAGHSAFETFSVLTRLPPPLRRTPSAVQQLLSRNFPATRFLSADETGNILDWLAQTGIGGGSVYDALVGATAVEHGLSLATRDQRAIDVYRALGVELEIISG